MVLVQFEMQLSRCSMQTTYVEAAHMMEGSAVAYDIAAAGGPRETDRLPPSTDLVQAASASERAKETRTQSESALSRPRGNSRKRSGRSSAAKVAHDADARTLAHRTADRGDGVTHRRHRAAILLAARHTLGPLLNADAVARAGRVASLHGMRYVHRPHSYGAGTGVSKEASYSARQTPSAYAAGCLDREYRR